MGTSAKFRRSLTFPPLGEEVVFSLYIHLYVEKSQKYAKKISFGNFFHQTNSKNTILYICIVNRKRRVRKALRDLLCLYLQLA